MSSFFVEMKMFEFRYVLHKDFEIICTHMDTTKFSHSFVDSSFAERIETIFSMVFSKNQYILPRFKFIYFLFYAKMHCGCIDNERYRLNDCILSHNSQERDWLYQRRDLKNSAESSLNEVIQWGNHCYNN